MKYPSTAAFQKILISLIILSLCLLPLLSPHIHLPQTHLGTELHSHQIEMHSFHLHTTQHDSIDSQNTHQSDTQQINLDTDTRLIKVFKILTLVVLASILLLNFVARRSITSSNYITPLLNPFEIFRALLRGPPTI